jgi:hypothetical protein
MAEIKAREKGEFTPVAQHDNFAGEKFHFPQFPHRWITATQPRPLELGFTQADAVFKSVHDQIETNGGTVGFLSSAV